MTRPRPFVLALLGGLAALGLGARVAHHDAALTSPGPDLREVAFVGSETCARCHGDHHASWARTHHARMTQEARGDAVLGRFDGRALTWFGWRIELGRDDGLPVVRARGPAGERRSWRVERTVGSRRYQQYLAREPNGTWWRLPVAWHVGEERFFHMNGAFLTPDPEATPDGSFVASAEDFERHVVRWNDNCVFCHNVGPRPAPRAAGGFETEVAELGVACEACHGPGRAHAEANADPLRRYLLHYGEDADPTVVDPAALTPARSADACGRCHGQRKTDDLPRVLAEGDRFVPGEDLARHSEPLWADTTLAGEAPFAARFWADGSPRLTAYEYQGMLQSPCTQRGDATCTTCHGMHEGDPAGQLRPELGADGSCRGCHAGAASDGHAGTRPDARHAEVACVDCHLPRNVYGVLGAHRAHRVQVPVPGAAAPDGCTLCHVEARPEALGGRPGPSTRERLFAGDPIERALAADAIGRRGTRERGLGALLAAMRHEPYPAVRRLAWQGARRLAGPSSAPWTSYRPGSAPDERERALEALEPSLERGGVRWTPATPAEVEALGLAGREGALWIGE